MHLLKFNNIFIIWIIITMMKIEMIMFDESLYINKHLYSLVIIIIIIFVIYLCHYLLDNNNIILYINLFNRLILNECKVQSN